MVWLRGTVWSVKLILHPQAPGSNIAGTIMNYTTGLKEIVINPPINCSAERLRGPVGGIDVTRAIKISVNTQRKARNEASAE
jgi:hypothetical protein